MCHTAPRPGFQSDATTSRQGWNVQGHCPVGAELWLRNVRSPVCFAQVKLGKQQRGRKGHCLSWETPGIVSWAGVAVTSQLGGADGARAASVPALQSEQTHWNCLALQG